MRLNYRFEINDETIERYFIFLISFLIYITIGKSIFFDPDAGWHIRAGEYIVNNLQVPINDPWTFTSDQQWYNLSWLFDVLVYLLHSIGGLGLLEYYTAALSALFILSIYCFLSIYGEVKRETKWIVCTLCGLAIQDLNFLRPQFLSSILALYTIVILQLSYRSPRRLLALIPIMLLWVNIHGSFPVLLGVLALHFITSCWDRNWPRAKTLAIYGVICLLITMVNPLGYKIYLGIMRTLDSAMSRFISEWQPWNINWIFSLSILMMAIILISMSMHSKKVPLPERILAMLWVFAAIKSVRFFGFLLAFITPYLAITINEYVKPSRIKLPEYIRWILLIILLVFHPMLHENWANSHPTNNNKEALQFFINKYRGKKIFNDYTIGGYLIYFANGAVTHYIDGRAGTVFSENFIKEYIGLSFLKTVSLDYIINHYGFEAAIIKLSSAEGPYLDTLFSQRWRLVYKDGDVCIYEKI